MSKRNYIAHDLPNSHETAITFIKEKGEAAIKAMRDIACQVDPSGIKIDQRIQLGFAFCDVVETAGGHFFSTNHDVRLPDVEN